jgi:protein-disulfide isomerase
MTSPRRLLLAALAAGLLGGCRTASAPGTAGPSAGAGAGGSTAPAEDTAAALPGVSLEGLSPEQQRVVVEFARSEFCYCGCPHTVTQCLRSHGGCKHSARMARLAALLVKAGAGPGELKGIVGRYYASFDRRQRLDVAGFDPPLGSADAPVTIVEFSDFTCPYCQLLRPALEKFVEGRAARVKLFYKPFPIESHPGALDAAQAGEWAREKGIFWPMHDALFSSPGHALDDLADDARAVGGDPGDLRDAISSGRYVDKVRSSQAEARGAGIRGTPSLFFDGRLHVLPILSDEILEFTLEDEEEWQRHSGWERD